MTTMAEPPPQVHQRLMNGCGRAGIDAQVGWLTTSTLGFCRISRPVMR